MSRGPAALACALLAASAGCAARQPPFGATPETPGQAQTGAAPATQPAVSPNDITLLVGRVEGLALFHDEELEAQRLIAGWAREHGLRVIDVDAAAQIVSRARAGLHPHTGQACGRPLRDFEAVLRWRRELGAEGRLSAFVGCGEQSCSLSLQGMDRLDWDGELLVRYQAPFDPALAWRQALARALEAAALQPEEDFGAGGLGMLGTGAPAEREPRPESLRWRAWPARDLEGRDHDVEAKGELAELMPGGGAALRRCFGEESNGVELLLELGAAGEVRRCQSRNADDAPERCACEQLLQGGRINEPLRGLRVFFGMALEAAELETPDGYVVTASSRTYLQDFRNRHGEVRWRPLVSDPSVEDWEAPPDSAIERCFAQATGAGVLDASVRVSFGAAGRAVDAALEPAPEAAPTARQIDCLRQVFLTSRAPCPAVAQSSAVAQIRVGFEPTPRARR